MTSVSVLEGEHYDITYTTIHETFEHIVNHSIEANKVGMQYESFFLEYAQVSKLSTILTRVLYNQIMHHVSATLTDWQFEIIAVDSTPSHHLIVCLLAILKLGCAYLPINSSEPDNQVKSVLRESKTTVIIAPQDSHFIREKDTTWSDFTIINLNELFNQVDILSNSFNNTNEKISRGSSKLAIVMYTSGSTGAPKGVKLSHRAVLNRLCWQWQTFPFNKEDTGCFKTSLTFVDSVAEIFGCLLKMVPLIIASKNIQLSMKIFATFLKNNSISRLVIVPSVLKNLCNYLEHDRENHENNSALRLCVCSGETLKHDLAMQFFDIFPSATLANFYGSTEVMADVTYEIYYSKEDIFKKAHGNKLSIGRPIYNTSIYLLNQKKVIVPKGDVGEIYVSGQCLSDGYINKNLTEESFVSMPFENSGNKILYKMGDLAKIEGDSLIFEGRRDNQVKVLGKKVNLAEVEATVRKVKAVNECIVLNVSSEFLHHKQIVAFYTSYQKVLEVDSLENDILKICQKYLPPEAQPFLCHVENIPLQANSAKVSRSKLVELYKLSLDKAYSAVVSKATTLDVDIIIQNILSFNLSIGLDHLNMTASFVSHGGNSLKILQTVNMLRDFGFCDIPIELFEEPYYLEDIITYVANIGLNQINLNFKPIGQSQTTFVVKSLQAISDTEQLLTICAQSFSLRGPLDIPLGITIDDHLSFCRYIAQMDNATCLSFVVFEDQHEIPIGGAFLFDMFADLEPAMPPRMHPLSVFFGQLEESYFSSISKQDLATTLNCFLIFVNMKLPVTVQLSTCRFIEENTLTVAREHNFKSIVTINTHPVTQVLNFIKVRDYLMICLCLRITSSKNYSYTHS